MNPARFVSTVIEKLSPGLQGKVTSELMSSDGWRWRRGALFAALIFLGASISFITLRNTDNPLNEQIVFAEISAFVSLLGCYVFAAVWDDKNKRQHLFQRQPGGPFPPNHDDDDADSEKPCEASEPPAGVTPAPTP